MGDSKYVSSGVFLRQCVQDPWLIVLIVLVRVLSATLFLSLELLTRGLIDDHTSTLSADFVVR